MNGKEPEANLPHFLVHDRICKQDAKSGSLSRKIACSI